MRLFEKFNRTFGFTRTESRVVLFLVVSFIFGIGVKTLRSGSGPPVAFDYTASDSEFAALSSAIDTSPPAPWPARNLMPRFPGDSARAHADKDHPLDLNMASKAELIALPGIGEVTAEKIILYRKDHGKFSSVDELSRIKGIGPKKLERLRPLCRVEK